NARRKLRRGSGDGEDTMAQIDLSIVIPIAILAGLGFAGLLTRDVLRRDTGTDRMREITAAIQQGARAFLRRQYRSIAIIAVILAIVFAGAIFGSAVATGKPNAVELGLKTAVAFALFGQLGGGMYTKAADGGAYLVGKVEAGIPEDDPRNPAVIAYRVGDNAGDCAGRGADLFESTAAENIGARILGVALFPVFG